MDTNETIRNTENNSAATIRESNAQETMREWMSYSSVPSTFGMQKFRDYNIQQQLPTSGSESDIYLVDKGSEQLILKLFRYKVEPKFEILNKIVRLSKEYPAELIRVYEFGYDEPTQRWYSIQEFARYGSLKNLIEGIPNYNETKQEEIFVDILREVSDSLKLLHENGILHLDLKPTNILARTLDPLDLVLIDFGISSSLDSELSKKFTAVRGTPMYQSPESWVGAVGEATDWWSLGMIAYEIANGKHPFEGIPHQAIASQLTTKAIDIPSHISRDKAELLRGLLTRDMSKRWGQTQVSRWLGGERNIPEYFESPSLLNQSHDEKHNKPFSFMDEKFTSIKSLARAIAADETSWDKGRESLMRGNIRSWLESNGDFEEAVELDWLVEDVKDPDEKLFRFAHHYGKPMPFSYMGKAITIDNLHHFQIINWRRSNKSKAESVIAEKLLDGNLASLLDFYLRQNEFDDSVKDLKRIFGYIQGKNSQAVYNYLNVTAEIRSGVVPQNFAEFCEICGFDEIEAAIRLGVDVNSMDNNGKSPLMRAAQRNENPDVIYSLLKAGADINAEDKGGMTPLMYAARSNNSPEVISALLKKGNVNAINNSNGRTALMYAADNNSNPEIVSVLLNGGAVISSIDNDGMTALMHAAWSNSNPEIVSVLIKAGADVNVRSKSACTALIYAAMLNGNPAIISILLDAGADATIEDGNGNRALNYAAQNMKIKKDDVYSRLQAISKI